VRENYKQRLSEAIPNGKKEDQAIMSQSQVNIGKFRRVNGTLFLKTPLLLVLSLAFAIGDAAQTKRKVILDQDARGPATTDQQSMLMFLQSPEVETLGITVVSGDMWRDEEVAHTLRMLEIVGRTDVPVLPGAVYPLINNMKMIERWETLYGGVNYQGAWNGHKTGMNMGEGLRGKYHEPFEVPPLVEGNPTTKAANEDAAHFIVRMVRKYPHEVTIYAAGPLTNLALAISIDPQVSELAQELVVMGGSIAPVVPLNWVTENRREFNFWWDPEATHITLCAPWHKITITTVDISVKTRMTMALIAEIAKSSSAASQYLAKYADEEYMWDELAAATWLDPSVITKEETLYMDIDIGHGASYGNVLVWSAGFQPGLGEQLVHLPTELNREKFEKMFVELMARATPGAHPAGK
jgi:inosine-uridine nucleoside N-ribohydrolase